MLGKIITFCLVLSLFLASPSYIFAVTSTVSASPTAIIASPSATPIVFTNSFELFWPMVAGKTMQSRLYFLKGIKEQVRGVLIFGSSQKANYNIFLGIKRMLEVEVLMKANVSDLANKTLDSAIYRFESANTSLTDAKNGGDIEQSTKDEINIRVSNLKVFTQSLIKDYPSYSEKLQMILDKLNALTV